MTDARPFNLADRTVLLFFSASTIGNSRKVEASTADISTELVQLNKKLLDSPELESVRTYDGEFRRFIDSMCLPFNERGIRILSLSAVERVEARIREYQANRAVLVQAFVDVYTLRMREAEERLSRVVIGGNVYNLFRPQDYLSEREAQSAFRVSWHYRSLGETPTALRGISPELFESERAKAEARMSQAADEITAVMRFTLSELVNHLRDRLTDSADGKRKVLRDSAITNLTEFLSTFSIRNVTDDSALSALTAQCSELLEGKSPDMFRESDSLRSAVASRLTEIKTQLDVLVTEKPSRKFRFEEE